MLKNLAFVCQQKAQRVVRVADHVVRHGDHVELAARTQRGERRVDAHRPDLASDLVEGPIEARRKNGMRVQICGTATK